MDFPKKQQLMELIEFIDNLFQRNNIWYTLSNGSAIGAVRESGIIAWDEDIDIYIKIQDKEKARRIIISEIEDKGNNYYLYRCGVDKGYAPVHDRLAYSKTDGNTFVDIWRLSGTPNDFRARNKYVKKCYYTIKFFHCKANSLKKTKNHRLLFVVFKGILLFVPQKLICSIYDKLEVKYKYDESEFVYPISSPYGMRECVKKVIIEETVRHRFENMLLPIPKEYDKYLSQLYGDYMTPVSTGYKPSIKVYK